MCARKQFNESILPKNYLYGYSNNNVYYLTHHICGKQFGLKPYQYLNRLKSGLELCLHCNPLRSITIPDIIPSEYRFISIDGDEIKFLHKICDKQFIMKRTTFWRKIDNKEDLCTICNPLIEKKNDIKSLLSIKNYEIIKSVGFEHQLKHIICDKTFNIKTGTVIYRIQNDIELCTICNPTKIAPIQKIPKAYKLVKSENGIKTLIHSICGNEFSIKRESIHFRLKNKHEICTICNPFQKQYSQLEIELVDYIKSIYDDKILSEKTSKFKLGMFTLDVYIPKLKLGIEFNGDYYHANPNLYKPDSVMKNYKTAKQIWDRDKRKINLFKRNDIEIFVIWEHDWINNTELIKQQLRSKLSH